MPRMRSIHPEACESETLSGLSRDAECLFWRLITQCDDYGRMRADPLLIASRCYPLVPDFNSAYVGACLTELHEAELIHLYTDGEHAYLAAASWNKYQRPKNPSLPHHPAPNDCVQISAHDLRSDMQDFMPRAAF